MTKVMFYKDSHFAVKLVNPKLINKILILLMGIKMAAIMGDKSPCTAKDSPIILYTMEIINAVITITLFAFASCINCSRRDSSEASKMASLAGVKLLVSSVIAIPTCDCFNAPASFRPSPNMTVLLPVLCNASIIVSLSAGCWLKYKSVLGPNN